MDKIISIGIFLGGFILDSLTLRRADLLPENLVIIGYLLLVAICITLLSFGEAKRFTHTKFQALFNKYHQWVLYAMQFAFGGLGSAFLIFYSRSASLVASWPFLVLIIIYILSNELLRKHYVLFAVRMSAFFFTLLSYLIFLFPILFKQLSMEMFVLGQVVALVCAVCFVVALSFVHPTEVHKSKKLLIVLIGGIVVVMNGLYFFRLIPPVPLLLQDARAYQFVERTSKGYIVVGENARTFPFVRLPQTVQLIEGGPVYVYASVFSPQDIDTSVVHKWQYFDDDLNEWQTLTIITIPIVGGRENGYRTFSTKSFVPEGKWKVDVALDNGQIIGRVDFRVRYVDERPELISKIK